MVWRAWVLLLQVHLGLNALGQQAAFLQSRVITAPFCTVMASLFSPLEQQLTCMPYWFLGGAIFLKWAPSVNFAEFEHSLGSRWGGGEGCK